MEHFDQNKVGENLDAHLTITIGFDCNNQCISCMLDGIKDKLKPVSFEEYKLILEENVKADGYKSLTLSGAEVTLKDDLFQYVEFARGLNFFKNIRIQTNGRKLANYEYCKSLIAAGVNEYFVSIYGPDEATHQSLTRAENSFNETVRGLGNLDELDAVIITNTVVTRLNYKSIPDIIDLVSVYPNIKEMQFWNYLPMNEIDSHDLLLTHRDLQKYLGLAFRKGKEKGISIIVQGYPECLLGEYKAHLDESRPPLIIDKSFWKYYGENEFKQCKFQEECDARHCRGLIKAYANKFGWDQDIIRPIK